MLGLVEAGVHRLPIKRTTTGLYFTEPPVLKSQVSGENMLNPQSTDTNCTS